MIRFLILLLILNFSHAKEIANNNRVLDVIPAANNHIVIAAKSCEVLEEQVEAVTKWTKKIGENTSEIPKCTCKNKKCSVDLSTVSPLIIRELHDKTPDFHGPNCWNASLVASKILPHIRFSYPSEMSFWMNSPLCRKREAYEELEPGDIIAIRSNYNETHGFVYLTPELSFSKNGYYREHPYGIMPTDYIFNAYGVEDVCENTTEKMSTELQKQKAKRFGKISYRKKVPITCYNSAQAYTCQTWEQYWENKDITSELYQAKNKVDEIECHLEQVLLGKSSSLPRDQLRDNFNIIVSLAKQRLNEKEKTDDEILLWESLQLRAFGLLKHIK